MPQAEIQNNIFKIIPLDLIQVRKLGKIKYDNHCLRVLAKQGNNEKIAYLKKYIF